MSITVRRAEAGDVPAMVALIGDERQDLARRQPTFWRPHPDAPARTAFWFGHLLAQAGNFAFIAQANGAPCGFLLVNPPPTPPVYEPDRAAYLIDDFIVAPRADRADVLKALFAAAEREIASRGPAQLVVIAVTHDEEKTRLLEEAGLVPVCRWWTKALPPGNS